MGFAHRKVNGESTGLENFGDALYPYGKYGRHEEARTPDLYRVKAHLFNPFNNLNRR